MHILAYTCIYCQQQLYRILKILHVYAYVYARICTYIVMYMQVNARICNYMERLATSRTKKMCIYVQYVQYVQHHDTSQHTCIYELSKSNYTCI
jgi:hypothetical protein